MDLRGLLGERFRSCLPHIDHPIQDLLDGGTQVLHQMEAVGDLNRVGRTLGRAFGKRTSTVTRDDLYARMGLEPGCKRGGIGIRQQLKWPIGTEINQDGLEILAFAIRPFINTEKCGRRALGEKCAPNQAQDGGRADGHALALGDASGERASDLQPELALFGG
jgi:hypothetical protein